MEQLRRLCNPTPEDLGPVIADFLQQMEAGLKNEPSLLKMLPSFFEKAPAGTETGVCYAVDVGGTNFRVVRVVLGGGGKVESVEAHEVRIPPELMKGTTQVLFAFFADTIAEFVKQKDPQGPQNGRSFRLGFTFSFPCQQLAVNRGTLLTWTKGFNCTDGPGLDVVDLLTNELKSRAVPVEVAALVNDTVGTLAAAAFVDHDAVIGVILGTGTNACYIERRCAGTKVETKSGGMIINIEWGNFAAPSLPMLEADGVIDHASVNPGQQTFEKMLSGMYLGQIAKEVLCFMDDHDHFFTPEERQALCEGPSGALSTAALAQIDADRSPGLEKAREAVRSIFGADLSEQALGIVKEVCGLVGLRSARLAGAACVAILARTGLRESQERIVVAVDGGLYEHYGGYADSMLVAIRELMGPGCRVETTLARDGSGLGAALLAASLG